MPQVINTNIASLNAQRNLNASQGQANVALERLSSGLRINSAKDDAAGLAISERFQSQIAGLNQAQRNANDGISLAQTAEGAMDEITNNLQRIRELAVQSANATNSISDRQALNQEVQQRIEEINRIASQTSFNGLKVLDGTFATQTFQVGANTGETIAISGLDSRGSQIGSILKETSGLGGYVLGPGEPATTRFDVSSFSFNGTDDISGDTSINGVALSSLSLADVNSPTELATAIQTEIDDVLQNGTPAEQEALTGISVDSIGQSLVFQNQNNETASIELNLIDDVVTVETAGDLSGISDTTTGTLLADADVDSAVGVTEGGTFSFNVSGTVGGAALSEPYEISVDTTGLDRAGFLAAINEALDNFDGADLSALQVTDSTNFVIAGANGDSANISNIQFTGNDGGSLVQTTTLAPAEDLTLIDSFTDGNSYNFNVDLNGTVYNFEGLSSLNDIVSQVNAKSNETGIQANLNADNDEIFFSSQFGEPFTIDIQADLNNDGTFDALSESLQSVVATAEDDTTSMNDIDISTREGADLAMIAVDYAIDTINGFRAELGAVQNRFESTIANLATTSENLSASNSRIRDADFAAESAELARTQVLQQAGLSVLAQANARPQQVLQLLQG
ncbi:flagellin [Marinobacter manganoxydans]|jgi:flagellin|uniref:Flagellin n=1 Tax=Marinobacter manganoxydans MnI7-9 TaxID=1094979 RepID=G6YQV4_9GAMM|nr:flagellin [Marinobacter manganoxydans]EHJ05411.1 flagellin domain-containing protein [Marinobacter manganoxydans MnI7-9]